MIYKNNKSTGAVYYGKIAIQAVYKGYKKVWELISSCFGKGFWINNKEWDNNDGWKN